MGKLIVVEGLDGSGKATQARLLSEALKKRNETVRMISFPNYNSPSSSLVKMYLRGEFGSHPDDVNAYAASSFYAVDRYASYKKDWKDDYEAGVVIADRYTTSNAIHQCSKLPKTQWDSYLKWLFQFEYNFLGIPAPDIVVYLCVEPEVSQKLLKERYGGRDQRDIHEKDTEYLHRCYDAAKYCSKLLGWKNLECSKNGVLRSVEDIDQEIITLLERTIL